MTKLQQEDNGNVQNRPTTQHPRPYPTIDLHAHVLPFGEWPDWKQEFGYGGFIRLEHFADGRANMMRDDGTFFREIEENCWNIEKRLRDMDTQGVDFQVLCTVPVMFAYWAQPQHCLRLSQWLNDDLAHVCRKHRDRFAGLGTIPLQDVDLAVKELRRCVKELDLRGVQIGSHVGDLQLDDPCFYPLWEAAQELDTAILVHPWDMVGKEKMPKYWMPWLVGMPCTTTMSMCSMIMGGVFEKFPRLKVCFAHGGGSFAFTVGRISHGFQVRPDLCQVDCKTDPREFIGRFWVDSITHDDDSLEFLVKRMGDTKVCLGSDQPFPLGEQVPGKLIQEHRTLSEEQKRLMLFQNSVDFLGLTHENHPELFGLLKQRQLQL